MVWHWQQGKERDGCRVKLLLGAECVSSAGAVSSVYGAAQARTDTSSAAAALAVVHHASLTHTLHQHGDRAPRGSGQEDGQAAVSEEDPRTHPHHLHPQHVGRQ